MSSAEPESPPDLRGANSVLCVQPHYDDNDIGAGGTIAALAAAGTKVHYLTVTDDLVGVLDRSLSSVEATRQLRAEQDQAGQAIGVATQCWLEFPDAGRYDYFDVRARIIGRIREVRPDFVLSVDPFLPYEAHRDHQVVGRAAAEAALLFAHVKIEAVPPPPPDYRPHRLKGVAFYFTTGPNTVFDIGASRAAKHAALGAYRSQFDEAGIERLRRGLEIQERQWAAAETFEHGEALKVLAPHRLHVNLDAPAV